jgi:arylsulfatase A-like enzyme
VPVRGHAGNAAIRVRPWKLVREEPNAWELYDLAKDGTELKDLSDNHPDGVSDLAARWSARAARVGVVAWEVTLSIYAERGLGPVEAAG